MSNDAEKCLNEIIAVCDKYGYVLSHEDDQGAFLLKVKSNMKPVSIKIYHDWLREADVRD